MPPYYDSLVAKIIVHAENREECLAKSRCALDELVIDGIFTTTDLHKKLIRNKEIISGDFDIHWLENNLKNLT